MGISGSFFEEQGDTITMDKSLLCIYLSSMKNERLLLAVSFAVLLSCSLADAKKEQPDAREMPRARVTSLINPEGGTLQTRILSPQGY